MRGRSGYIVARGKYAWGFLRQYGQRTEYKNSWMSYVEQLSWWACWSQLPCDRASATYMSDFVRISLVSDTRAEIFGKIVSNFS